MTDTDRILQALERLETGQRALEATVEQQGKVLTGRIDNFDKRMDTLELKVEVFHSEQKRANEEMLRIFHTIEETNTKALERRIDRIEKHIGLPPLK